MDLIEAKTISEYAPDDLPALDIMRRAKIAPTVRICAVGDIGLSGRAIETAKHLGWDALFADIAPLLKAADITFGNLESPLAGEIAPRKMFAAPVAGSLALRNAGFNLVHLANNHLADFGKTGMATTLSEVCRAGMVPLGAGDDSAAARQLIRTDVNNVRIGWLGCGRTLLPQHEDGPQYWEYDENELLGAVVRYRPTVDVLIVSIHIGLMFIDFPHPAHKAMAERLMQAGANLILMHHAHVLQGIQVSDSQHICCYNLGNFLWDCLEGDVLTTVMLNEQQEGAVFVFDLDACGVTSASVLPTIIDSDNRVRWAVQERGYNILKNLERISVGLERNYKREFDRQRIERNLGHTLRDLGFYAKHGDWKYVFNRLLRIRLEHLRQVIKYPFTG